MRPPLPPPAGVFRSEYSWIITKDHNPVGDTDRKGVVGPSDAPLDHDEIIAHADGRQFRMKCDDGEVIYEGIFVGDADSELAFGPLDDFGTPDYGCTSIEYWNIAKTTWETL